MKGIAQTSSSAANQVRRLETQGGAGTPLHAATASRQERRLEISTCRNYRRGEYFQKALAISNSGTNPAVLVLSVTAGGTAQTGKIMLAPGSQTFLNDADGNLTNDHVWCYQWDAENRLIQMDSVSSLASTNRLRLVFEYDWRGRRIRKTVTRLDTSAVTLDNKFLYDDWNQIAELNATNNNVIRSYVWGVDLSGSLQGAGGVGGLLMVKDASQGTHFAAYDLNGNMAGLVSASYGTNTARYEYGPFGELIRATGPMAKLNPFRFSTKYQDDETDLLYYGYRYYSASTGRWLSRDPIEERGGKNLYGFVQNNPLSIVDHLGLVTGVEEGVAVEAAASIFTDTASGSALMSSIGGAGGIGSSGIAAAGGVAAAGIATGGLLAYDLYLLNQIYKLNNENAVSLGAILIAEKQLNEQTAYHKRCDEKAPPNLKGCDLLNWILQRSKDCVNMRQAYIDKWNDTYQGHKDEVEKRKIARDKVQEQYDKECKPCPKK